MNLIFSVSSTWHVPRTDPQPMTFHTQCIIKDSPPLGPLGTCLPYMSGYMSGYISGYISGSPSVSPDQQCQHLILPHNLLNQKFWAWGPAFCFNKPSR